MVRHGGGGIDGFGECSQQVVHLIRHMRQADHFTFRRASSSPQAEAFLLVATSALDPLGQLAQKVAAGHVVVELLQSFLLLQEIPQAHAVLQQQTHKLRLVANQG